jgi:hypothetical protein
MSAQHRMWSVIGVIGLIVVTMACTLPFPAPQATPTITPTTGLSSGGSNGGTGNNSSGSNGGNTSSNNGGNNSGSNGGSDSSSNGSPTQLAEIYPVYYVVKQIETLGGEAISGTVCSVIKPFSVLSVTPRVTFTFYFVPQDAQHGNVSYAYSIPSAGESHDARGTYSLAQVDKDGTLQLSMSVSDHVVFKGFDGNIPNNYKFNLVPSGNTSCPPVP